MRIKTKTPRTEMAFFAITVKMNSFLNELGEELGVGPVAVDVALTRYATVSTRVEFDKKEVDFELALPTDTPEQIRKKVGGYMDTANYIAVEDAARQIDQLDMPLTPPEQQPTLPDNAEKK